MTDARSDTELARAYVDDGDADALRELFSRHMQPLHAFLLRIMGDPDAAEDAAQETFIKAWKHLRRYDRARNFRTWLYAIAHRTALDMLKKRGVIPVSRLTADDAGADTLLDALHDPAPPPSELLDRADAARVLNRALDALRPTEREVLLLRFREDMTFKEIGEALGKPLDTVKSQVRRALAALAGRITDPNTDALTGCGSDEHAPKPD